MSVMVDVAVVSVLLAGVVLGARHGFLQSLAGVIVAIGSFLGARWLANRFADPVAQWLRPLLEQRLTEKIQIQAGGAASVREMLSVFGYKGRALADLVEAVNRQALQTGQSLLETVVDSVVHAIAYAAICFLAFFVLLLVLRLLLRPLELTTKLPGMRTLNVLGGATLGFLEALLLVYLVVWALQQFQLFIRPQLVEDTIFLKIIVRYNPIGLIPSL